MSEPANPFVIDVLTLFPGMFTGPLGESILRRAMDRGLLQTRVHDLRNWATDRHRTADDVPYGGGAGMVMSAPLIVRAVDAIRSAPPAIAAPIIILSASGRQFHQDVAQQLARGPGLILICGHYEGIDARAEQTLGATEYSIGDYILTGGELPAMVIIDAVCRLLPGVIDAQSIEDESHSTGYVEYPHFTRPDVFRGLTVPTVLRSGRHQRIAEWRRRKSLERTATQRPDLLTKHARRTGGPND